MELYTRAILDLFRLSRKGLEFREEVLREASRLARKGEMPGVLSEGDVADFDGWCVDLRHLMAEIEEFKASYPS